MEVLYEAMLVGDIGLNISSVRRNGDIPILAVLLQKVHVREHRSRVLGAESDDIHYGRIEAIPADLAVVIGIANADHAFFEPVRKPLCVKCRYICSLSCVDDHIASQSDCSEYLTFITGRTPME